MITLDLAALAMLPDAEKKISDYVVRSIGGVSESVGKKFICNSFQQGTNILASTTQNLYYYGYRLQSVTASLQDPNKFMFGDISMTYYLSATTGTLPTVYMLWYSPPALSGRREFYHNATVLPLVVNEVHTVKLPMVPISEIHLLMQCAAASTASMQSRVNYNCLYFERAP